LRGFRLNINEILPYGHTDLKKLSKLKNVTVREQALILKDVLIDSLRQCRRLFCVFSQRTRIRRKPSPESYRTGSSADSNRHPYRGARNHRRQLAAGLYRGDTDPPPARSHFEDAAKTVPGSSVRDGHRNHCRL